MNNLTEQQIDLILNEEIDQSAWLFQLGISTKKDFSNTDNDFSFPFYDKGKELWNEKFKPFLKTILCDKDRKTIKLLIDEGLLGNARELAVYIYMELTKTHNIEAGIAIPLIAITIKYNLHKFCSE